MYPEQAEYTRKRKVYLAVSAQIERELDAIGPLLADGDPDRDEYQLAEQEIHDSHDWDRIVNEYTAAEHALLRWYVAQVCASDLYAQLYPATRQMMERELQVLAGERKATEAEIHLVIGSGRRLYIQAALEYAEEQHYVELAA